MACSTRHARGPLVRARYIGWVVRLPRVRRRGSSPSGGPAKRCTLVRLWRRWRSGAPCARSASWQRTLSSAESPAPTNSASSLMAGADSLAEVIIFASIVTVGLAALGCALLVHHGLLSHTLGQQVAQPPLLVSCGCQLQVQQPSEPAGSSGSSSGGGSLLGLEWRLEAHRLRTGSHSRWFWCSVTRSLPVLSLEHPSLCALLRVGRMPRL